MKMLQKKLHWIARIHAKDALRIPLSSSFSPSLSIFALFPPLAAAMVQSASSTFLKLFSTQVSSSKPIKSSPSAVNDLPILKVMKDALHHMQITKLFNIQKRVFLPILVGKDILLYSKTGTGKTLAYLLPILQRLHNEKFNMSHSILILVPTRELCKQVGSTLLTLQPSVKVALVYGGSEFHSQMSILKGGAHIVVATPSRALQMAQLQLLNTRNFKVVCIDEADAMLGTALIEKMKKLLDLLASSEPTQTILITASMTNELKQMVQTYFPKVAIADLVTHVSKTNNGKTKVCSASVDHRICKVSSDLNERIRFLIHFLTVKLSHSAQKCIVFTNSYNEVNSIVRHPSIEKICKPLHANLTQNERDTAIHMFTEGTIKILVCSDLVSRGLDFRHVSLVLHFHPPENPNDYIHRSGRTGRANASGESMMLYDKTELKFIERIAEYTNQPFHHEIPPKVKDMDSTILSRLLTEIYDIPSHDYEPLMERANKLLATCGHSVVSVAMAILEGRYTYLSDSPLRYHSQLTGRKGYLPIILYDPSHEVLTSKERVIGYLRKVLPNLQGLSLGHIMKSTNGYIADIPVVFVEKLLSYSSGIVDGIHISTVHEMPRLIPEEVITRRSKASRSLPWSRMRASLGPKSVLLGRRSDKNQQTCKTRKDTALAL